MAEIKINILEINNSITKLKNLQSRCNSLDTKPPTTVGGGKTVNELESIAALYKNMNTDFCNLISNTISFLQNVKTSYVSSDQKAATKISSK